VLHSWPEAQAEQLAPAAPHEPLDSEVYATQVVPLQHPLGHEEASQTHWPVLLLHSSPPPQASHVPPPAPQEELDSLAKASQVEPLQQPAHEPPPQVQEPLAQVSPVPHGLHAAPAAPHSPADWEA
jgi:hypothetical protein